MIDIDINELFINVGETYHFETIDGYDNIESMGVFLNEVYGLEEDNIHTDDGTAIILQHSNYDYLIRLDSGGDGDFCHHRIDTSIYSYIEVQRL